MKRSLIHTILLVVLFVGGMADSICGQTTGAEAIVDSALTRLTREDWTGFVKYLHPTTLKEFKYYVIKITRIRLQTGANDSRFDAIFGRPTLQEVQDAPPDVLFANFLRGAVQAVPDFGQILGNTRWQILGVVDEGADLRHVVIRQTYTLNENMVQRVEVLTLEKAGGDWKLQLPPNIETFLDELGWPKLE